MHNAYLFKKNSMQSVAPSAESDWLPLFLTPPTAGGRSPLWINVLCTCRFVLQLFVRLFLRRIAGVSWAGSKPVKTPDIPIPAVFPTANS